jgi:NAD(P)-dependent dehydrogenase (short-subunit alcohol dehydrogenase family)
MSSPKPLMLLLGSGSNIGQAVARKFEAGGYNVAIAARSLPDRKVSDKRWSYTIDLSNPNAVAETFAKVTNDIGIPNVVVYNGKEASIFNGQNHNELIFTFTLSCQLSSGRRRSSFYSTCTGLRK